MKLFHWKPLLIAPALVPCLFSLSLMLGFASKNPLFGFLIVFLLGCFFSYSITIVLFLPGLYLLGKITELNTRRVNILGLILGAIAFMPIVWMDYSASGEDSGSPSEAFSIFFMRQLAEPFWWLLFPGGGLLTANFYWWLNRFYHRRKPLSV